MEGKMGIIRRGEIYYADLNPASGSEIPTHVDVGAVSGLHRDSMVLLEQIRTLDKQRLQGCVGALGFQEMKQVDKALKISFGLFSE